MIDQKTQIGNFFNKDEIVQYKSINDLSEKIIKYSNDNKLRKAIAKKGRAKYFKYFNSKEIAQFIIDKTFEIKKRYFWEIDN
jgi:spore maturation protein CgeB